MPYTYLIGWSDHSIYYYGSRYAQKSNPNDLWKSYFTSSKEVKLVRQLLGEPDVVQVRRIFEHKQQAVNWEYKVLRRMKVVDRTDFLNKHCLPAPPINRMFGKDNPQSDPKWRNSKSVRAKQRANQYLQEGKRLNGSTIKYFDWSCKECCCTISKIDNVKNRKKQFCNKSCARTFNNKTNHPNKITIFVEWCCEYCGNKKLVQNYKHVVKKRFCNYVCSAKARGK